MDRTVGLMSYLEVAVGLETRIGAGEVREIVDRCKSDPSIRICVPEPESDDVRFRVRFGMANLTDDGPEMLPGDHTEERGAWLKAFPTATRAVELIPEILVEGEMCGLPSGPPEWWFRLDLYTSRLEPIDKTAIESQIRGSNPREFLVRPLVRLAGARAQVSLLLEQLRAEKLRGHLAGDDAPIA